MTGRPIENTALHDGGSAAGEDHQSSNLDEDLVFGLHGVKMRRIVVVVIDRDRDPIDNGDGWHLGHLNRSPSSATQHSGVDHGLNGRPSLLRKGLFLLVSA